MITTLIIGNVALLAALLPVWLAYRAFRILEEPILKVFDDQVRPHFVMADVNPIEFIRENCGRQIKIAVRPILFWMALMFVGFLAGRLNPQFAANDPVGWGALGLSFCIYLMPSAFTVLALGHLAYLRARSRSTALPRGLWIACIWLCPLVTTILLLVIAVVSTSTTTMSVVLVSVTALLVLGTIRQWKLALAAYYTEPPSARS